MDNKQQTSKYLIVGLLSGIMGGMLIGERIKSPRSVLESDLNNDGILDLVVEGRGAHKTIFFKSDDGLYHLLDDVIEARRDSIETTRDSIEARYDALKR